MKLPAFQFYPADWRKSTDVQAMSFHDRGIWFELLCLMHESEDRGRLVLGGRPIPDKILANLIGISTKKLTNSIQIFLEFGVAFRDESGALCNRRMMRDEQIRRTRAESGKLGGNPILLNQKDKQTDKQKPTPSSSSSISSSEEKNKELATQGGDAANGSDPVSSRIWTDGTELVKKSGFNEKNAKSFLGKMAKEFGKLKLAEGIAVTQAANVPDPQKYLVAVLQDRAGATDRVKLQVGKPQELYVPNCSDCSDTGEITVPDESIPFVGVRWEQCKCRVAA